MPMDTQNTPIHIKLWHREFWLMAFANMLLMMSSYSLIPLLDIHLSALGVPTWKQALVFIAYGIGLFALGGFCSYWVQRYRRYRIFQYSALAVALTMVVVYYTNFVLNVQLDFWMLLVIRWLQGAFLGLAQMTLASTLIIDTCESFQRTEANHAAAWFARFSLALGPITALFADKYLGHDLTMLAPCAFAVVSFILVSIVKFPFKAPSDTIKVYSLDRFFLTQGFPLFINLMLTTTVVGILLSRYGSIEFYGMILVGFFLALLAEKFAFADADLKSEIVSGLVTLIAAVLITTTGNEMAMSVIMPALIGFGIGIIGTRFLLFFIKLAKHCQRGTSQSTFFLAWEFGLSLGVSLGIAFEGYVLQMSVGLLVACLLLYNLFVHKWYMSHKNR